MAGIFDKYVDEWGDGGIEFTPLTPEIREYNNNPDNYGVGRPNPVQRDGGGERNASGSSTPSSTPSRDSGRSDDSYDKEMEKYVKYLRDALKASSGWKREELKAKLDDAEKERQSRAEISKYGADRSYDSTKYSSDRSYESNKYGADRGLEGTKYSTDAGERNNRLDNETQRYGADQSLAGTKYASDASSGASRYGSDRDLEGQKYSSDASRQASMYGSDRGLEGTKYGVDADLYKFGEQQPLERADRALALINNYAQMASNPANVFQASEYARNGRNVAGMPTFISDLLGQTQSAPLSRVSSAPLPGNMAQSVFGSDPLAGNGQTMGNVGYPDQQYTTMPVGGPGQGTALRGASVSGMRSAGMAVQPQAQPQMMMDNGRVSAAVVRDGPVMTPDARKAYLANPGSDVYTTQVAQQGYPSESFAGAGVASPGSTGSAWADRYGSAASAAPAPRYNEPPIGSTQRSLAQRGMLVEEQDPAERAALEGIGTALQRGVHTWDNGSIERMGELERGALESGIKYKGLNANDTMRAYERTRIGNADPFGLA